MPSTLVMPVRLLSPLIETIAFASSSGLVGAGGVVAAFDIRVAHVGDGT